MQLFLGVACLLLVEVVPLALWYYFRKPFMSEKDESLLVTLLVVALIDLVFLVVYAQ